MFQTIYLDNHATTACDTRVLEAMWPYFASSYGNASSTHRLGIEAHEAIIQARQRVAKLIQVQPSEIVFTSGATESNNLAILGSANWHRQQGGNRKRIVISTIEHKSILSVCHQLALTGWEVRYLSVNKLGRVDLTEAQQLIDDTTLLVSVQAANSEIGTIQPIAQISQLAHQVGSLIHCDAAQMVGKVPIDVMEWGVDLLSLSGHKMHAPKGIGALFVSRDRVTISPILYGGGQERGLRSGTLPVPLIVGLGEACNLSSDQIALQTHKMRTLRDRLENNLLAAIPSIRINGDYTCRLPNNSNITFFGIEAELLLAHLSDEIMVSTGSACQSGSVEPSTVLTNIGMDYDECFCTLRFGLSRFNTVKEIDYTVVKLSEVWQTLAKNGAFNLY